MLKNPLPRRRQQLSKLLLIVGIATAGCLGALGVQAQTDPPPHRIDPTNVERVALGQRVYASFCTGCHGVNLEGQPNWRQRLPMGNYPAPPHDETGHTWHHADQWLFDIVKYGGRYHAPSRYRSAMPAYKNMLSDEEIRSVLAFIKSRWPASIRAEQEKENRRDR
jgi:mono/diheme cytochrome c family protein